MFFVISRLLLPMHGTKSTTQGEEPNSPKCREVLEAATMASIAAASEQKKAAAHAMMVLGRENTHTLRDQLTIVIENGPFEDVFPHFGGLKQYTCWPF